MNFVDFVYGNDVFGFVTTGIPGAQKHCIYKI